MVLWTHKHTQSSFGSWILDFGHSFILFYFIWQCLLSRICSLCFWLELCKEHFPITFCAMCQYCNVHWCLMFCVFRPLEGELSTGIHVNKQINTLPQESTWMDVIFQLIEAPLSSLTQNSLALIEGLHGSLPLLQLKLHHTSQIGSVGLELKEPGPWYKLYYIWPLTPTNVYALSNNVLHQVVIQSHISSKGDQNWAEQMT